MVQLKLSLKSKRPTTLYSSDGKSYRLLPGSNTLNLEYEDYLALAKTLGLKSILPPQASDPKPATTPSVPEVNETPVEDTSPEASEETHAEEPVVNDVSVLEDSANDNVEDVEDTSVEEPVVEETPAEDIVATEDDKDGEAPVEKDEPVNTTVDYDSMSYQELREEYKRITGVGRNLKREALIAFLQEHANNV